MSGTDNIRYDSRGIKTDEFLAMKPLPNLPVDMPEIGRQSGVCKITVDNTDGTYDCTECYWDSTAGAWVLLAAGGGFVGLEAQDYRDRTTGSVGDYVRWWLGISKAGETMLFIDVGETGSGGTNHTILDGSTHTDTVADTPTRGSLIYGNSSSPSKWDELAIGSTGKILTSNGTDLSWQNPVIVGYIDQIVDVQGEVSETVLDSGDWRALLLVGYVVAAAGTLANSDDVVWGGQEGDTDVPFNAETYFQGMVGVDWTGADQRILGSDDSISADGVFMRVYIDGADGHLFIKTTGYAAQVIFRITITAYQPLDSTSSVITIGP